jgi:hypothetical protein
MEVESPGQGNNVPNQNLSDIIVVNNIQNQNRRSNGPKNGSGKDLGGQNNRYNNLTDISISNMTNITSNRASTLLKPGEGQALKNISNSNLKGRKVFDNELLRNEIMKRSEKFKVYQDPFSQLASGGSPSPKIAKPQIEGSALTKKSSKGTPRKNSNNKPHNKVTEKSPGSYNYQQ